MYKLYLLYKYTQIVLLYVHQVQFLQSTYIHIQYQIYIKLHIH